MKKTGFTLIELLAVIVILAIIALIVTPTILGVIEKARKGASEQSALGYIDAVEKQVAINQVKNENLINDGTYNVPMTGITVKGEAPTKGWLKIEKGLVTNYSFVIGKYVVTKGKDITKGTEPEEIEGEVIKSGPTKVAAQEGDTHKGVVYLDPTDLTKNCDASNSVSTTGTKTGCMKWYIYSEDETNYNMILDHNTTAIVNSTDSSEVEKQVAADTSKWDSNLKTRLITTHEVADVTNLENWLGDNEGFCLATGEKYETAENGCSSGKYSWLFVNTYDCEIYGCDVEDSSAYGDIGGYWTHLPGFDRAPYTTWYVNNQGALMPSVKDKGIGIRPVITISKDVISE